MKTALRLFRRPNRIGAYLVLIALSGLSLLTAFRQNGGSQEKLLGLSFDYDNKEVTIKVVTSGCTVKSDFQFKATGSSLQVIRLKRDVCKMVPQAVSFTYTLAEAGLKADQLYVLKNKLIANPNLANIP